MGSKILSFGHYQPSRVITNDDLAARLDTTPEWIGARVGILERRIAGSEETVASMAITAVDRALANSSVGLDEIDMVIVATCTAQNRSPNTAAQVASSLGLRAPAIMDINVVCSGFVHAMAVADHAIRAGACRHAIVVGADKMSEFIDWDDRSTCPLFGDGAGAVIIGRAEETQIGPVVWGSALHGVDAIRIQGQNAVFSQDGQRVFRWALTELPHVVKQVCERSQVHPADLSAVVFHQANLRIIEPMAKSLGALNATVSRDVVESGNTNAASIPIAASKLWASGTIAPGSHALLFGFGGGLAYAGLVVKWPKPSEAREIARAADAKNHGVP